MLSLSTVPSTAAGLLATLVVPLSTVVPLNAVVPLSAIDELASVKSVVTRAALSVVATIVFTMGGEAVVAVDEGVVDVVVGFVIVVVVVVVVVVVGGGVVVVGFVVGSGQNLVDRQHCGDKHIEKQLVSPDCVNRQSVLFGNRGATPCNWLL